MGFFNKKNENTKQDKLNVLDALNRVSISYDGLMKTNEDMNENNKNIFMYDCEQFLRSKVANSIDNPLDVSLMRVRDENDYDYILIYQKEKDNLFVMQPGNYSENNIYDYKADGFPENLKNKFELSKIYMNENLGSINFTGTMRANGFYGKPNYKFDYLNNICNEVEKDVLTSSTKLLSNLDKETINARQYITTKNDGLLNLEYATIKEQIEDSLGINLKNVDLQQYKNVDINKYMDVTSKLYSNLKSQNNLSMDNIDALFASIDAKVIYPRFRDSSTYNIGDNQINNVIDKYNLIDKQINEPSGRVYIISAKEEAKQICQYNALINEKNAPSRSYDCKMFCASIETIRETMSNNIINNKENNIDFQNIKIAMKNNELTILETNNGNTNIHNVFIDSNGKRVEVDTLNKKSIEYVNAFKQFEKEHNSFGDCLTTSNYLLNKKTFKDSCVSDNYFEDSKYLQAYKGKDVNMNMKEALDYQNIIKNINENEKEQFAIN